MGQALLLVVAIIGGAENAAANDQSGLQRSAVIAAHDEATGRLQAVRLRFKSFQVDPVFEHVVVRDAEYTRLGADCHRMDYSTPTDLGRDHPLVAKYRRCEFKAGEADQIVRRGNRVFFADPVNRTLDSFELTTRARQGWLDFCVGFWTLHESAVPFHQLPAVRDHYDRWNTECVTSVEGRLLLQIKAFHSPSGVAIEADGVCTPAKPLPMAWRTKLPSGSGEVRCQMIAVMTNEDVDIDETTFYPEVWGYSPVPPNVVGSSQQATADNAR